MAIVIDLILIGIVALFTFIGYKQGLVKAAIKILSFIIAVVVSLILYKPVSSIVIRNTSIDENIKNVIVENVELKEKEEQDSTEKSNIIKENLTNKIIAGANNTIEEVADSFTVKLIEISVILLLYIIARIILKFISALSDLITNLPIIKQANKTGGIIYGFLKGILIVYAILAVVYLISPMINTNAFGIIDSTILTKEIYNNNILLTIVF
ncbi:MAG: CvpA family protein [Clostridia bacterium]|nr:CvpA family protein [Clostridia bacterium]